MVLYCSGKGNLDFSYCLALGVGFYVKMADSSEVVSSNDTDQIFDEQGSWLYLLRVLELGVKPLLRNT